MIPRQPRSTLFPYTTLFRSSRAGAKSFGLPAFRAVEDDPHHKIVREIFEAVLDAGWHEQYVARAEGMAVLPVDERPVSAYDHVHLIAGMRRLRVAAAGRVDLDLHAPVFEYLCEPLSSGSWQPPHRLGDRRPASPCRSAAFVHLISSFRIASMRRIRFSLTSGHSSSMML